jgi:seryl-tRNA synthetase
MSELENLVKKEQELFYRAQAEQFQPDKRKFIEERNKILKRIEELRAKSDAENRKLAEQQKAETIKQYLPKIRFVYGDAVPHLMHGEYTTDVVTWNTPTSTEIEVNKRKVDLLKLLSPITVRHMIEHPLSPVFFEIEPTGAYQKGKKLGYYISGEWEKTRDIEIRTGVFLALMVV